MTPNSRQRDPQTVTVNGPCSPEWDEDEDEGEEEDKEEEEVVCPGFCIDV